jgi:type IV secretory pathway TraG/TraD family ATPase VirD4
MNVGQVMRLAMGWLFLTLIFVVLAEEYIPGFMKWFDILEGIWNGGLREWVALWIKRVATVFVWPVVKIEHGIERYVLWPMGIDIDLPRQIAALQILILSFVLWSVVITRSLKAAGLYNPFWNTEGRKRGLVLRGWIRLRDWWEIATRFGRESTAKWASLPEVMSHRYCGGDIFLGRPKLIAGGMLRPVGIKTEKHIVTIAAPGAGKSTDALIPNLCLHEGSLLAVDVKGELTRITGWRRGAKGLDQAVYAVDPYHLVTEKGYSAKYNPFDEMARVAEKDPDRAVSYAAKIAEALVRRMSDKETYWDDAAKTFIRGLVLYIFSQEDAKRRNMLRLRELVMRGDTEGYEQAVAAKIIERGELNAFDYLLEKMAACKEGPYADAITSAAGSILMMGEGQKGSVLTTAQEHTAFLDTPELRKICETSDFLLEDFKTKRISVFLVLPINELKGAQGRWLRMFILLFIDMMVREEKAPNPPVLLAIDEFPNLGRLDGIELVAPVMRSYGVRFWAVAQDIGQLKAVYPDVWTGFIGGAEAVQFMGVNHPATVDFIVERLGEWEVIQGSGERARREVRPLLDREQVSRFLAKKHKNQIVWFGSQRPMKLKLCPYYEYLPWWYYTPDERFKERPVQRLWRSFRG